MSRLEDAIRLIPIYKRCYLCDFYDEDNLKCNADATNCEEEIARQIIEELNKDHSPLLSAYKQGTKEYKIASDNYEYGYQKGIDDAIYDFVALCEYSYPRDWANRFDLGGRACHFSLIDIHKIAEQVKEIGK